jgi:hypothetical protein
MAAVFTAPARTIRLLDSERHDNTAADRDECRRAAGRGPAVAAVRSPAPTLPPIASAKAADRLGEQPHRHAASIP